jgi:hypothetical protein
MEARVNPAGVHRGAGHRFSSTGWRGARCVMMLLPPGVKVHLAFGYTDMRKGIDGLAMLVQGVLRQDPFSGHLFVFRGRVLGWDRAVSLHQAA